MFGSRAVQLGDGVGVGAVAVERPELAASVPEQHQEVFALTASDLLQHTPLGLGVHGPREHAVLNRVQHYTAVGLRRRLFVQTRTWTAKNLILSVLTQIIQIFLNYIINSDRYKCCVVIGNYSSLLFYI